MSHAIQISDFPRSFAGYFCVCKFSKFFHINPYFGGILVSKRQTAFVRFFVRCISQLTRDVVLTYRLCGCECSTSLFARAGRFPRFRRVSAADEGGRCAQTCRPRDRRARARARRAADARGYRICSCICIKSFRIEYLFALYRIVSYRIVSYRTVSALYCTLTHV
jgi:hypothetical protein